MILSMTTDNPAELLPTTTVYHSPHDIHYDSSHTSSLIVNLPAMMTPIIHDIHSRVWVNLHHVSSSHPQTAPGWVHSHQGDPAREDLVRPGQCLMMVGSVARALRFTDLASQHSIFRRLESSKEYRRSMKMLIMEYSWSMVDQESKEYSWSMVENIWIQVSHEEGIASKCLPQMIYVSVTVEGAHREAPYF